VGIAAVAFFLIAGGTVVALLIAVLRDRNKRQSRVDRLCSRRRCRGREFKVERLTDIFYMANWKFIGHCVEGEKLEILGINVWSQNWVSQNGQRAM